MLFSMLIGFIGGIIFLSSILLIFCAVVSREWINADIEATIWDESHSLAEQSEPEGDEILYNNIDGCQDCQQPSGDPVHLGTE